ncbi:DEAD/DEAH box helicase [Chloroflexi bacterium TSY]|nr:DEAD/DEAH box helicase [Chloroflexi bacterium TSY]
MNDNPFYRLAPFIQEYIYRHQWTELRDIQVQACEVLFDTDAHLILAAGTASGKTEAAFLPILTSIYEKPPDSLGVLYIGPTKALINDQFERLTGLLEEVDIPVWAWHGDISSGQKRRLIQNPRGVLQITPESLESLLINRTVELAHLFCELRFVVIDEIHVFMSSERGRQVLCLLERLARSMNEPARRIGLSATLGDYTSAERWLRGNSQQSVMTAVSDARSRIRLSLEHFYQEGEDYTNNKRGVGAFPHVQYIFDRAQERTKTLIFANNRRTVEETIGGLRQVAQRLNLPDIYHVHHGSISAGLREAAEDAMKDEHMRAVTAATVTLELGIDIGQLERIIQLEAPFSVASFLQRLGRSGRRGDPSEMWFVCCEEMPTGHDTVPKQLPWSLLQSIAMIQLYVEEKWIEPIRQTRYPYSLLYHQTMSTLTSQGELTPANLARQVLTLSPLRHISQDDYRLLLQHLIETDQIERMENGGLIVGLVGERVVRNFRFYANFEEKEEYLVRSEEGEIGRITEIPAEGERFGLAGRTWEVEEVNSRRRMIFVKLVGGQAQSMWRGGGGEIHTRLLERMRQVLAEKTLYRYLQPRAQERLADARQLAQRVDMHNRRILPLGGDLYAIFPWVGTIGFNTLARYVQHVLKEELDLTVRDAQSPYYLVVKCPAGMHALDKQLTTIETSNLSGLELLSEDEAPQQHKYDRFVPKTLLRKGYVEDYLDLSVLNGEKL